MLATAVQPFANALPDANKLKARVIIDANFIWYPLL